MAPEKSLLNSLCKTYLAITSKVCWLFSFPARLSSAYCSDSSESDLLNYIVKYIIYCKSTHIIASRFYLSEVVFYYWNPICIATSKYCKSYCKLPQSIADTLLMNLWKF